MPPPAFDEALSRVIKSNQLPAILKAASTADTAYLNWDKLRQKNPPAGLSVEDWWLAIRMERKLSQRTIPSLKTTVGEPFTYSLPDEVLKAVEEITRDASGVIAISDQVTSPATRDRYIVSSLIEEAITSSQLEGASTTRRDAKQMLRTGRAPQDTSERMILNNYRAMQRVAEVKDEALTPSLVRELHRIVTDETLDDPIHAGHLQDDDLLRVAVWGHDDQLLHKPPPVAELPERLEALCEFANGKGKHYIPPVLRAITLHFMVGYDHYFEDGNGRTARAIFYWSMLHQGFWLTEFLTISRILKSAPSKYAKSFLLTEQDDGDLTHFFIYHLSVIQRAISDLQTYLGRKLEEIREAEADIRARPGEFNNRELALLRRAVAEPGGVFTAKSHASYHRVTVETARADLLDLERKGFLVRARRGNEYLWQPPTDLGERLHSR